MMEDVSKYSNITGKEYHVQVVRHERTDGTMGCFLDDVSLKKVLLNRLVPEEKVAWTFENAVINQPAGHYAIECVITSPEGRKVVGTGELNLSTAKKFEKECPLKAVKSQAISEAVCDYLDIDRVEGFVTLEKREPAPVDSTPTTQQSAQNVPEAFSNEPEIFSDIAPVAGIENAPSTNLTPEETEELVRLGNTIINVGRKYAKNTNLTLCEIYTNERAIAAEKGMADDWVSFTASKGTSEQHKVMQRYLELYNKKN